MYIYYVNKFNLLNLISDRLKIELPNGQFLFLINFKFNSISECRKVFKNISCVYVWHNLKTGKVYIGSAVNLWRRFLSYKQSFLFNKEKNNIGLKRACKKYGVENIKIGILEIINKDKKLLKRREQFYLDTVKPFKNIGYNISRSADRPLNCVLSQEGRKKIKERHTGENSEMSKLKNEDILNIKQLLFEGKGIRIIAFKYKVSTTVVSNIARGKTWSHIKASDVIEKFLKERAFSLKHKLGPLIPEIVELLKQGHRMIDISKKYKIKYPTLNNIKIRYITRKNLQ